MEAVSDPGNAKHDAGQAADTRALHSDGVVCRCAIRWRKEALARGLADSPSMLHAGDPAEQASTKGAAGATETTRSH